MGIVPLGAAIKVDLLAPLFSGQFDEPLQKGTSMAILPSFGIGNQIIDVENPAPGEKLPETEAGQSYHFLLL